MEKAILQAEKIVADVEKLGTLLSRELQKDEAYKSLFERINYYIKEFRKLRYQFNSYKLKIPFIGHFSSGKSSLINSFLGYDLLDVDIKPETDKPYEIFYSSEPVEEIEKIKVGRKGEIEVVKVGWHFDVLKNHANIVLVDLPGVAAEIMDSSGEDKEKIERIIRSHNLITRHYLLGAEFYIVVVDVSRGSLGKDLIEFIKVKENVPFAILLHKADKVPSNKRDEIKNHILKEISPLKPCLIEYTSVNDVSGLKKVIELADRLYPNIKTAIFRERFTYFLEEIADKIDGIRDSLNIDIDFLEDVLEEVENEVKETQKRLEAILNKKEEAIKRLIRREKINSEGFFNDEERIEFWAKHVDDYEKDVSDFSNRLMDRLIKNIETQIDSMQSEMESLLGNLEDRLGRISEKAMEASDNIRKIKKIETIKDVGKIKKMIDALKKIDVLKKIKLIAYLLDKLEKLLKLSKISSIFSNPITWIFSWGLNRFVGWYAESKIKEANEKILYDIKNSLDELLYEIEGIFEEIRSSMNISEELENKRKELDAVRRNRDKIKKFSDKFDSTVNSLKEVIASINSVEIGDRLC